MKTYFKIILAVIVFSLLVVIGNWPGGSSTKDEWDNLIKWAKNKSNIH